MAKKLNITVGSDNVFHDLDFPEAKVQNLLLRADLVVHIRKLIESAGMTQAEAAKRAGITQPRMNDLVKGRTHKFTLDALVNVAANLGYSVQIKFKKAGQIERESASHLALLGGSERTLKSVPRRK